MRIYCTLKYSSNKKPSNISIDVLSFETPDGKEFDIDFDQGDYSIEEDRIHVRLKSLGSTFADTWGNLREDGEIIELENDVEFFKTVTLYEMQVYIEENIDIDFELKEINLDIQGVLFGVDYEHTHVIVNGGDQG